MYKLVVFGNGGLWSVIKESIDFTKVKIVAFIHSDPNKQGTLFDEIPVINPNGLSQLEYDYILLASGQYDMLLSQLQDAIVPEEKIIAFKLNDSETFHNLHKTVNNQLASLGNYNSFNLFSNKSIEPFHLCNMNLIGRERKVDLYDRYSDYVRLSTLELVAEEINSKQLLGNVAELGVYKGEFAKHINSLFPNKQLYLFDTFEGFHRSDVQFDMDKNFSIQTNQFSDTNVNMVLHKMKYPEKVIIRKGYFPETSIGLEDQFAFVSIDTDLYKPIYDGLNYFYPRLTEGGYIFVHDYNNSIFKGAREAVRKFCSENKVPFVPMSDNLGTVVICK